MKFLVADREYAAASLYDATLIEHLDMKRQTSLSIREVEERLAELADEPFKSDPGAVFESDRHLMAFGAVVWLARWRAGERLSFEDACSFPLADFTVVFDDEDVVPDPPKAPKRATRSSTGQGRGPARKRAAAKKSSTPKTSKRTSRPAGS